MSTPWTNVPSKSVAELRSRYRHLVWSNPEGASDDAYLYAALRRASFFELLDFSVVFGLDRVQTAWQMLQVADPVGTKAAQVGVSRILSNLQQSVDRRAQARHSISVETAAA